MIRIRDIALPPEHNPHQLNFEAAQLLKVSVSKIRQVKIVRRSVDARKKPDVKIIYTIEVAMEARLQPEFLRILPSLPSTATSMV